MIEPDVIEHKCKAMVKRYSEIFKYKGESKWYMRFEVLGEIDEIIFCPFCGTKLEVK